MFTKEQVEKSIVNIRVSRNVLTVEASLPLKKYVRDEKLFFLTHDIQNCIKDKYHILETIKEDKISNWEKPGFNRNGVWKFKIKKKPSARKPKPQPPVEPQPQVLQPPPTSENLEEKKETKKTSKTASFRGRIKKLASKK